MLTQTQKYYQISNRNNSPDLKGIATVLSNLTRGNVKLNRNNSPDLKGIATVMTNVFFKFKAFNRNNSPDLKGIATILLLY